MVREVDNIEIQGPPIDEIQKRSSCLKRSCASILVVILLILVFFIGMIKAVVTPNTTVVYTIPTDVPTGIPIYDKDNVDTITYTSGKDRQQAIELLAFVPKAILSPIILTIENTDTVAGVDTEPLWESFLRIMGTRIADFRNVLSVEWSDLQARPSFLHAYYTTTLRELGYEKTESTTATKSRFVNTDTKTTVTIETVDNGIDEDGTNYAILRIYYSSS